jgi:plasmid maintenance system antidote protein VapI
MPRTNKRMPTMTVLLRKALAEAESLYGVAKATGVQRASLSRFVSGRQSLRLDKADKLATYFRIESIRRNRS